MMLLIKIIATFWVLCIPTFGILAAYGITLPFMIFGYTNLVIVFLVFFALIMRMIWE
jgi:hypothetical protein